MFGIIAEGVLWTCLFGQRRRANIKANKFKEKTRLELDSEEKKQVRIHRRPSFVRPRMIILESQPTEGSASGIAHDYDGGSSALR